MRMRKLNVVATLFGMTLPVAVFRVQKYADTFKAETNLVCPNDYTKPDFKQNYHCGKCNADYGHFSKLKRLLKATGEEVIQTKLNEGGEVTDARISVMDSTEFAKYSDATADEYGLVAEDEKSAQNLRKMIVATTKLAKIVVITFNDTFEQRIAVLFVSLSGRILLKEIIPQNLLVTKETMMIDFASVSEKEIEEAKAFLSQLPHTTEADLIVADYRTKGLGEKPQSEKVLQLSEILAQIPQ